MTNCDSNFDLNFEQIQEVLSIIGNKINDQNLKKKLTAIVEKIKYNSTDFKLKYGLDIIEDKPLIKIQSLTPKFKDHTRNINITPIEKR